MASLGIVVVGGGVIGVCAAYYLARAGASVTLLERAAIAAGSSQGNAGLIVPSHAVPLAAPGVLRKGLRWMTDPESPFRIKPRLDPALIAWLWRFQRHCTAEHVRRALPVIRDLSEASLALYGELAALPGPDGDVTSWLLGQRQRPRIEPQRNTRQTCGKARLAGRGGVGNQTVETSGQRTGKRIGADLRVVHRVAAANDRPPVAARVP